MRCLRTSKFRENCLSHLSVSSTSENPEVIFLNFDKQVGPERDGTCVCVCVCVCYVLVLLSYLEHLDSWFLINKSLFYYTSFKTVTKTILLFTHVFSKTLWVSLHNRYSFLLKKKKKKRLGNRRP